IVTINGSGFINAITTKFNTINTAFTIVSDDLIVASVPPNATTGRISVITPSGTATSVNNFTIVKPPTITSFSPVIGLAGISVSIAGTNFIGTTDVRFNGISA